MDVFEKNEILQQVSEILQFCHEIVSKLSFSNPIKEEHYNDQIRELANIDKEANKELIKTIKTKFGAEGEKTQCRICT